MGDVSAPLPRRPRKKPSNKPVNPTTHTRALPAAAADTDTGLLVAHTSKLRWRDRAHRALTAQAAPTWSLDLRAVTDGVDEQRARRVLDLAMRIADSLLSTGASAAEVTAAVLRIRAVYGLRSVHVDVTFTSISVCHYRGARFWAATWIGMARLYPPSCTSASSASSRTPCWCPTSSASTRRGNGSRRSWTCRACTDARW